jgi:hypothetical protein
MKRRFGDRSDGYRLRNVDVFFTLIPYIMKTRDDSQVFFEDSVDIEVLEAFVKKHQDEIPGLKLYHVIISSMVRLFATRPRLNRFVCGSKAYARNNISISMAIKRNMTDEGEETNIKPIFAPESTLKDVVDILNKEVNANKEIGSENGTDRTAKIIGHTPTFLLKFVVNFLMRMDRVGILPKSVIEISPFHCSGYITNIGSLGIKSVYHHLYNFGTVSIFVAMGKKEVQYTGSEDGEQLIKKKMMSLKVVVDERICDGYYYASSMRLFSKLLQNPDVLLTPPEEIPIDDGIFPAGYKKA